MPITDIPTDVLARAAARRYLATEHRVIVRTVDRHYVAEAVLAEAAAQGIDDRADIDISVLDAAIEQIKAARVSITWVGEGAAPGEATKNAAEPTEFTPRGFAIYGRISDDRGSNLRV